MLSDGLLAPVNSSAGAENAAAALAAWTEYS
jgi:hypothetical protein